MLLHLLSACALVLSVLPLCIYAQDKNFRSSSTVSKTRTIMEEYYANVTDAISAKFSSIDPGFRIYFAIRKLNLVPGDTLEIYWGDSADPALLNKTLTSDDSTQELISTGDKVYAVFKAQGLNQTNDRFNGVRAYFFSIDPDSNHYPTSGATQPDAPTLLATYNSLSRLMSPNLQAYTTYGRDEYHWWMIKSPCVSYRMKLRYAFGSMRKCADGGTSARCYVYDGPSPSDPYLFESANSKGYCRPFVNGPNYVAYASGQYVLVYFYNNTTNLANMRYGFMLTYEIEADDYHTAFQQYVNGYVTDGCQSSLTAYCPFTGLRTQFTTSTYTPETDCTMLIIAEDEGYQLTLDFSSFELEEKNVKGYCVYDQLRVYDGNSANDSLLLNTYCGTDLPAQITSSGQYLLLRFHVDYTLEYSGFDVNYQSINASDAVCYNTFTEYVASDSSNLLTSLGYPTAYSTNVDEYWLISNPQNATNSLVIKITDIEIEKSPSCKYDRIVIYAGGCTKNQIVDIYCESKPTRFEYASAEYRLVRFHSDYNEVYKGFQMEYFYEVVSTTSTTAMTTTTFGPRVSLAVHLVEELVNISNYYSDQHPLKYVPLPVPTTIDFYLVAIHGLDEVQGKLKTNGYFHVTWLDEHLAWEPDKKGVITQLLIPQDLIWKPDITLTNGFYGFVEMGDNFMYCTVKSNGSVSWKPYQVLESSCGIDISKYPYEEQTCNLTFKGWTGISNSAINITIGSDGIKLSDDFVINSKWTLQNYTSSLSTDGPNNVLTYTLKLQRNGGRQRSYEIIPVVTLAFFNLLVFILEPRQKGNAKFALMMLIFNIFYHLVYIRNAPKNSTKVSVFGLYSAAVMTVSAGILLTQFLIHRIALKNPDRRKVSLFIHNITRFTQKIRSSMLCQSRSKIGRSSPMATWTEVSLAVEFICAISFTLTTTLMTVIFFLNI